MGKTNSVSIFFFLILSDYIQKTFHLKKSLTFDWHSSEIYLFIGAAQSLLTADS